LKAPRHIEQIESPRTLAHVVKVRSIVTIHRDHAEVMQSELGSLDLYGMDTSAQRRKMREQVCDVDNALLSASRMLDAGNRVVFDQDNRQFMKGQG
jgi:hypothetical protein